MVTADPGQAVCHTLRLCKTTLEWLSSADVPVKLSADCRLSCCLPVHLIIHLVYIPVNASMPGKFHAIHGRFFFPL